MARETWACPDCGFDNFADRDKCFKCNKKERQEGDWDCPDCGAVVFASRDTCYRCDARSRDGGGGGGKGGGKGFGKAGAGAAAPASLGGTIKALQRNSPTMNQVWKTYCDLYGEGWQDCMKHEEAFLSEFLEYVAGLAQADLQKEGGAAAADATVAAAAPAAGQKRAAAQPAAGAPAEKKKVTIKKAIATKIQQLNDSGTLLQAIRLGAVAAALSQLSEEVQLDCLELLKEQAEDIDDPNDYLKSQAQVMLTASANSEEA